MPPVYGPKLDERLRKLGDEITLQYGFPTYWGLERVRHYLWLNGHFILKKVHLNKFIFKPELLMSETNVAVTVVTVLLKWIQEQSLFNFYCRHEVEAVASLVQFGGTSRRR